MQNTHRKEVLEILCKQTIDTLPCEDIFQLEKILVKDNKHVVGVQIAHGYMGMGGSNRSDFEAESTKAYTIAQLSEKEPILVTGAEICAVVNDVLYFRRKEKSGKKQVYTLDYTEKERTLTGDCIAYDTVAVTNVVLLLAQD